MKINCNVIRDLLPLYEDGAVSEDTAELVREHLKDCPGCREELRKMRTPISVPPEEDGDLWERFEARRAKQRRKRRIGIACVASLLALIVVFCLWYTRPQTWMEITGEDVAVLAASLCRISPDWDAEPSMEKLKYEFWNIRQNDPRREEAGGKLLQVLNRYTFRAKLESLLPRSSVGLDSRDYVTIHMSWRNDGRIHTIQDEKDLAAFHFGDSGKVGYFRGWGYAVYRFDPALYDELTQLVLEYGTLEPPDDPDAP